MKIIIDSRMRKEEKEYLLQYGELIELKSQESVYEEISAHPDIFFCKIAGKIFKEPNININIGEPGMSTISSQYPNDIKYNICQIGNNVIHNFQYTDPKVLEYINTRNLTKIQVKQGYTKCNICPTSQASCITSDKGIYSTLKCKNIDTLLLDNERIYLQDKNGQKTKMNGFIGGATTIIDNTFILFGDIENLEQKQALLNHLKKYNLTLHHFPGQEIMDYGSCLKW